MRLTVDVSTGLLQIVQDEAKVTGHSKHYHDAFIPVGEVRKFVIGKFFYFVIFRFVLGQAEILIINQSCFSCIQTHCEEIHINRSSGKGFTNYILYSITISISLYIVDRKQRLMIDNCFFSCIPHFLWCSSRFCSATNYFHTILLHSVQLFKAINQIY